MTQTISAFTKPWKVQSLDEICRLLQRIGFNGMEYCLREGYQIEPSQAQQELIKLKNLCNGYGITLTSIAGPMNKEVFMACSDANIPFIRTLVPLSIEDSFEKAQELGHQFIESFLTYAEEYKVIVGLQLHTGSLMNSSFELYRMISYYNSPYLRAIWDSAHSTLAGENPKTSLSILFPYLCSVNLKNVDFIKTDNPEQRWRSRIVTGKTGIANWPLIVSALKSLKYDQNITITHEYDNQQTLTSQLQEDCDYLKSLW